LGRDEFAILLPRSDANRATETAQRILNALEAPFDLTDIRVEVRASIGISLFPGHGTDPELLLLRADSAVTQAKRTHTGYALFRGDTEPENRRRLSLVGDLRRAIEGNELLLYYQPKIDMRSGLLCGAEALVRWQHPDLGLVSPDKIHSPGRAYRPHPTSHATGSSIRPSASATPGTRWGCTRRWQ